MAQPNNTFLALTTYINGPASDIKVLIAYSLNAYKRVKIQNFQNPEF